MTTDNVPDIAKCPLGAKIIDCPQVKENQKHSGFPEAWNSALIISVSYCTEVLGSYSDARNKIKSFL